MTENINGHTIREHNGLFICEDCHAGSAAITHFKHIECGGANRDRRDPLEERGP